jgi:hypothetical protein
MKTAFLFAFMMMASTSAFAGEAQTMLANLLQRPSPSDCYLECKPMSGGGNGDGFTKCYNECMSRR